MGKNIINNEIKFEGNSKRIAEILKEIANNNFDFQSYVSTGSIDPELQMTDYMNVALRMYRDKYIVDKKNFDDTIEFVCAVGEKPYDFNAIDEKTICAIKSQNQASKMLKDAKVYISNIESKKIFNGLCIRECLWGSGGKAINVRTNKSSVKFDTYFMAPTKVVAELARRYHDVKLVYTYSSEGRRTIIQYVNGDPIRTNVNECDIPYSKDLVDMYAKI